MSNGSKQDEKEGNFYTKVVRLYYFIVKLTLLCHFELLLLVGKKTKLHNSKKEFVHLK